MKNIDVVKDLNPMGIWHYFAEIGEIPRPSKKEEKIIQYIVDFAESRRLEYKKDNVGNIVITVPAKKGYENAPVVVLQAHLDMVCEKNKSTQHNFDSDPIRFRIEGDWLMANNTTLGADNGIGVAAALAVITDPEAVHGPLEVLLTIDEETGMTGVKNLKSDFISGKYLLNMDSEEDGIFYIGCAGGQDTVGLLPTAYNNAPGGNKAFEVLITGLKGGHSGVEIHLGRANAIKILGRYLRKLEGNDIKAVMIKGGSLRNAIPREAEAILLSDKVNILQEQAEKLLKELHNEYKMQDPDIQIIIKEINNNFEKVLTDDFIKLVTEVIYALPHGYTSFHPVIKGLVETSSNLATLEISDGKLRIGTSQRSSIESAKDTIADSVKSVFHLCGAEILQGDGYPGWIPDLDADLLRVSINVYKSLFGNEPEIKAIHAGLETGLLGAKYPELQMISFGPTIQGAHSPTEKILIKDVEKFYSLLKVILLELAKK